MIKKDINEQDFLLAKRMVIGVCARDDEIKTITPCLESIKNAISKLPNTEIVVCLNDYYDDIYKYLKNKHCDIKIITSFPGVICAQKAIVDSHDADFHVFIDADSIIEPDTITKLISNFENPAIILAYGNNIPIKSKKQSIIEKIYCLYANQTYLTKRKYFHGRFFASKKMIFPKKSTIDLKNGEKRIPFYLKQFMKDGVLIADDIYMSYVLIQKYGTESISESENANVYFNPIKTISDFYESYRRTRIEILKCNLLFPEFKTIEKNIERKTDWYKWYGIGRGEDKILWIVYLALNLFFKIYLYIEMVLSSWGIIRKKKQWKVLTTTK